MVERNSYCGHQSYFFVRADARAAALQRVLLPIGTLQKPLADRELAENFELLNRNRPDSLGLLLPRHGQLREEFTLGAYLGDRPGPVVDAATTGE
jgi:tRNA U34 2-thiouridine synthase MnmA/TrmU